MLLNWLQVLYYYTCCDHDLGQDLKFPEKKDGLLLISSIIFQLVLNAKITAWKYSNKVKIITALFRTKCLSSKANDEVGFLEKQTIVNSAGIFCGFSFFFFFFGVNSKLKGLSVEQINTFPNYLYLYIFQLILFQLFGMLMLVTLYAKNKKMGQALYIAWKER